MTTSQPHRPDTVTLDIGVLVERTGVPTSTLHVWEQRGLIAPVGRNGLRRVYSADAVDRVATILLLQQTGFTLAEIASVLDPDAFAKGKTVLAAKLSELERRRDALERAIEGVRHALDCEHHSPLECDGFLAHLPEVLPAPSDPRDRPR